MGKNAQVRRTTKALEQAAKRRAIEEQYGIKLPPPSKPLMGGRYAGVKGGPTVRYPQARRGR
jgi:hypothetical protein